MKTTKTYLSGCNFCNATGLIRNYAFDPNVTGCAILVTCPVCNGTKIITVTETIEDDLTPIK